MTVQLIIDTDGVSDDVRAISLALQHPDADVIAVTTVHGCVPVQQATANVQRTLRANNANIPVYQGAAHSLLNLAKDLTVSTFFGIDGIGDLPTAFPEVLPSDFDVPHPEPAPLALARLASANPQATIVCLGPLTNIALALRLDPSFASLPNKLVIMGGNYFGIGNVDGGSSAEYNFHGDPEAADIVLREMLCPITVVPWEAFYFESKLHEKSVDFSSHLRAETPLASYLSTATSIGREKLAAHGRQYSYCDEIAVATAIDQQKVALETKKLFVAVELNGTRTRGQVVVDWVEQLWNTEDDETEKRRRITFVTSYDVKLVDSWLHAAVGHPDHKF